MMSNCSDLIIELNARTVKSFLRIFFWYPPLRRAPRMFVSGVTCTSAYSTYIYFGIACQERLAKVQWLGHVWCLNYATFSSVKRITPEAKDALAHQLLQLLFCILPCTHFLTGVMPLTVTRAHVWHFRLVSRQRKTEAMMSWDIYKCVFSWES